MQIQFQSSLRVQSYFLWYFHIFRLLIEIYAQLAATAIIRRKQQPLNLRPRMQRQDHVTNYHSDSQFIAEVEPMKKINNQGCATPPNETTLNP